MNNFVKHGDIFDVTNNGGSGISSGDVVVIGDLVGVAETDILVGNTGSVLVSGVFNVAKKTGEAWTQGEKLYWDPTNSWFTATAGSLNWVGWAFTPQLSADAVGEVKLKAA